MESTPIDPAMGAGPEAEDATNVGQREKSNLSDKLTYVGVNGECFNTILFLFFYFGIWAVLVHSPRPDFYYLF